jgi:hypothetical protein
MIKHYLIFIFSTLSLFGCAKETPIGFNNIQLGTTYKDFTHLQPNSNCEKGKSSFICHINNKYQITAVYFNNNESIFKISSTEKITEEEYDELVRTLDKKYSDGTSSLTFAQYHTWCVGKKEKNRPCEYDISATLILGEPIADFNEKNKDCKIKGDCWETIGRFIHPCEMLDLGESCDPNTNVVNVEYVKNGISHQWHPPSSGKFEKY